MNGKTEKTKKLINNVDSCVDESLQGAIALNPGLALLRDHRVVLRRDFQDFIKAGKVATLCGGGSGHEPIFYGMVGKGLMTGAIHGPIFASPSSKTILAALRAVGKDNTAGIIIVFNNYTGDRLHFGHAVERAKSEGMRVAMIIVGEDCALMSKDKTAGKRGLAGSGLVMKIVGAMAEEGKSFEEITTVAETLLSDIGTLGVCLSPCSLPGGGALFELGPQDMEIGLGLHGEAGVKRSKLMSAHDTITTMVDYMTSTDNPNLIPLPAKASLAVFLNNLGSTSDLEMNILTMETISLLEQRGHRVDRAYAGRAVTSQEMAGFSLSLMLLDGDRKAWLDAPTTALCWSAPYLAEGMRDRASLEPLDLPGLTDPVREKREPQGPVLEQDASERCYRALKRAFEALVSSEETLNALDSTAGDGDCGSTMATGARALLRTLGAAAAPGLPVTHPYELLMAITEEMESAMGGSSCALYSLFLTAAALEVLHSEHLDIHTLQRGCQRGIDAISKYGGAEVGDRTMLDPLDAFAQQIKEKPSDLEAAVKACERRAAATAGMVARAGRASYVESQALTEPDPGAAAVAVWVRAALEGWAAAA